MELIENALAPQHTCYCTCLACVICASCIIDVLLSVTLVGFTVNSLNTTGVVAVMG